MFTLWTVFLHLLRNVRVVEQFLQEIEQDQFILPVQEGAQLQILAMGTNVNGRRLPWMDRFANNQLTPQAVIMVRGQRLIKALLNSDLMLLKGDQLFSLALPGTVISTRR